MYFSTKEKKKKTSGHILYLVFLSVPNQPKLLLVVGIDFFPYGILHRKEFEFPVTVNLFYLKIRLTFAMFGAKNCSISNGLKIQFILICL